MMATESKIVGRAATIAAGGAGDDRHACVRAGGTAGRVRGVGRPDRRDIIRPHARIKIVDRGIRGEIGANTVEAGDIVLRL